MARTAKVDATKKKAAVAFLKENPLAKIVVIIDSHTDKDGHIFVCVEGKDSYADNLGPVCLSVDCSASSTDVCSQILQTLPAELGVFFKSPSEITHNHQSFILNMGCGSIVKLEKTRDTITAG